MYSQFFLNQPKPQHNIIVTFQLQNHKKIWINNVVAMAEDAESY